MMMRMMLSVIFVYRGFVLGVVFSVIYVRYNLVFIVVWVILFIFLVNILMFS